VGRRSFGKGLVQNPMLLIDSSMVRLTIARYHTPTGRLIQKPYDEGYEEYSRDLINRYNAGELSSADSVTFPDAMKYRTLTARRLVYGGGGIMPDYFVPIDTSFISEYHNKLLNRGILNLFVLNFVDMHRGELLSGFPDIDTFHKDYPVPDSMLGDLNKYAEGEGITLNEEEFGISRERIRLLVKSFLARDLWNSSGFYQVLNTYNPSVLKAVEVLEGHDTYQALLQVKKGI